MPRRLTSQPTKHQITLIITIYAVMDLEDNRVRQTVLSPQSSRQSDIDVSSLMDPSRCSAASQSPGGTLLLLLLLLLVMQRSQYAVLFQVF
ncbi:Hypothetical predicted protein [Scomber scombrus]|uniref:Uncharacterized protein n=1 Tax=Scomber scombrus TaxID=13677 RepID=A0AAV1PWG7_SCOSC